MSAGRRPGEGRAAALKLLAALAALLSTILLGVSELRWPPHAAKLRIAGTGSAGKAAPRGAAVRFEYRPSKLEAAWRDNIDIWQNEACARMASDEQRGDVQAVLNVMLAEGGAGDPVDTVSPLALIEQEVDAADARGLWSHMVYTYADGSQDVIRLEPLIGGLRDPRTLCNSELGHKFTPRLALPGEGGVSNIRAVELKMWTLVDPRVAAMAALGSTKSLPPSLRAALPPYRRAFLFDCGGSKWMHASGSRWLQFQFERIGVRFEHIYIWEAVQLQAADYFQGASIDSFSRLHFYNMPVTLELGHPNNPLTMLKAVTTPEDLVIWKLDIDHPPTELGLIEQMLNDTEVLARVDEFAFEYHVDYPDFNWIWWKGRYPDPLSTAHRLFHRLRAAGIRAHPWP